MTENPKPKKYRNKKYLEFIRSHPCIICGNPETDAHHIRRQEYGSGTGTKPHDYVTVPLCRYCHDPKNERCFNPELFIIYFLMEYIEANR